MTKLTEEETRKLIEIAHDIKETSQRLFYDLAARLVDEKNSDIEESERLKYLDRIIDIEDFLYTLKNKL